MNFLTTLIFSSFVIFFHTFNTFTPQSSAPFNHPSQFGVTDEFFSYFNAQNRDELYAETTALIAYTRADGSIITDFSQIDSHSTAHIFAKNLCVRDENAPDFFKKGEPLHLISTSCNTSKCEFSSLQDKTLEIIQENLFGIIKNTISFIDMEKLKSLEGNDEAIQEYFDALPHFEGWKDFEGNTLHHPKSGKIPAVFSGMQDCNMLIPSL